MYIAILSNAIAPESIGGTETQTAGLAKHLAKKHRVTVYIRGKKGKPKSEQRDGYILKRTGSFGFSLPTGRHISSTLAQIKKDKKKIDVLLCMSIEEGFIGVLAKKLYRIPVITWIRGGDWYLKKSFLSRLRKKLTLNNSNLVLAQTEKIKKEVRVIYPKTKLEVLPNGIELTNEKADGNKIVFVGNLIKRKGVKYLIEAVKGLKTETLIVGAGPEKGSLKKLADENVCFVGRVEPQDVRNYMKRGRVLVLPAIRGEGLPNVLIEAMSLGLPVVATRMAGIPDIVKDVKTGFLVKPNNSDELRKNIIKLLNDTHLHDKMRACCLKEVQAYSWEKIMKKLENMFSIYIKGDERKCK